MNKIDCIILAYTGRNIFESIYGKKIGLDKLNKLYPSVGKLEAPLDGAIAHLGSYLDRMGITFDFINSFDEHKDELTDMLGRDISTVGISTTYCTSDQEVIDMVNYVKKVNGETKITIGGAYIIKKIRELKSKGDENLQKYLKKIDADFYIDSFFGEKSLAELIMALKNKKSFENISDIYYYKESKYYYSFKTNEKYNIEDYMVNWKIFKDRIGSSVLIRTAKSCPFKCSYCNFPANSGDYQFLDVAEIESQLDSLKEIGKVKRINFIDDTFNFPQKRFKDTLEMMIKNNYGFKWSAWIRCQYLDDETVYLMKKSGCEGVFLGIESGDQEMLNRMNKNASLEDLERGIKLLNKYEIISLAMFIVGFPGETQETYENSIKFIEKCKPTFYSFSPWVLETNTPIWQEREKYNISGKGFKWSHYSMDFVTAFNLALKANSEAIGDSIVCSLNPIHIFELLQKGMGLSKVKEALNFYKQ